MTLPCSEDDLHSSTDVLLELHVLLSKPHAAMEAHNDGHKLDAKTMARDLYYCGHYA